MVDSDDVVRRMALWAANRKRKPEKSASSSYKKPSSPKKPKLVETNIASSDKFPSVTEEEIPLHDLNFDDLQTQDGTHSRGKGLPTAYCSSEVASILPPSWNDFLSILKYIHPSSETSNALELLGQSFVRFFKQINENDRSFEQIKANRDAQLRSVESLRKDLAALDKKFLATKVDLETSNLKVSQLEEIIKSLSTDLKDAKKKVEHLEELLKSKDLVIGDRDKTISDHICALERMKEEKAIIEKQSVKFMNQGFSQFHFALTHRFPDLKEKADTIKLNTACGHFTRHQTHAAEFDHDQEFLYPPFDLKILEALKVDISSLRDEDVEYSRKLDADIEKKAQVEREPNQNPSSKEVHHSLVNPDQLSDISAEERNQEKEDKRKNITASQGAVGDSKDEENQDGQNAHSSVLRSEPATSNVEDKRVTQSGNPFFTSIVVKSHLQSPFELVVPASFRQFLPDVSVPVVLVYQNRSWKVRCCARSLKIVIHCGWKNFATDNDLKIGDACVYELMNREELKFRVQILRTNILSIFADRTSDSKTEENQNGQSAQGSVQTSDPATSDVQDKVVPLSGNPIFTSIVVKYQLQKPFLLVVPKSFHQFLPDISVPVVLSYQNRSWKMRYWGQFVMRTICLGWEKFAIDNNLKVGDKCIYELVNRKELEFRVQIIRANGTAGQGSECLVKIEED